MYVFIQMEMLVEVVINLVEIVVVKNIYIRQLSLALQG